MAIKVVTAGGGTGHYEFLCALRRLPGLDISAIVSMADDGKSSGELRDRYGGLPPGDLLQCLTALTTLPREVVRHILRTRMTRGALAGHNLGNLALTFVAQHGGSFLDAVRELQEILRVDGQVLPATVGQVRLHGRSLQGVVVSSERNFDRLPELLAPGDRISEVWLEPNAEILPEAIAALAAAQYIFITPGDLWSSIVPVLLVQGMREAIAASPAQLVYACNLVTTRGQTDGFTVLDFVTTLERFLPRPIQTVLYHSHGVDPERAERYAEHDVVRPVAPGNLGQLMGRTVLGSDFLAKGELIRHDHAQLALILGVMLGILPRQRDLATVRSATA